MKIINYKNLLLVFYIFINMNTGACQNKKTNNMDNNLNIRLVERKAEKTHYTEPENLVGYYWETKEKDGTIVIIEGDKEEGFTEVRRIKNAYYEIYKEYGPEGIIILSGKFFGDHTPIGIWRYYDKEGNLLEEIDNDKKFGRFGYVEVLNFLIGKNYVENKTYKGLSRIDISFSEENKTWHIRVNNPGYIIDDYELDGDNGEIKSHKNFRGGRM